MLPKPHPTGLSDLDPLPEIPQELATVSVDALLLAIGAGVPLTSDPYAAAKMANYDRLLFAKMPILCDGPSRILTLGPTRRAECGAKPCCGRSRHEGGKGCIFS